MTTKVTIRHGQLQFQVDVKPTQTVAQLKDEITKSKGYATESLRLIHSGKALTDSGVTGTIGIKEGDHIILLVSKAKEQAVPSSTKTLTAIEPLESSSKTASFPSASSLKGKEVVRDGGQTSNEIVPAELPIKNQPQLIGPSPEATQTAYRLQASTSSLSAWQPPVQPALSKRNNNHISIGDQEGDKTLGKMGDLASLGEMIRTSPSMRQIFIETATQHDPAFGQKLSQNPALLDSLTHVADAQANLQADKLSTEERGAVRRAYLVSDKNEEFAVDYLLNSNAKGRSDEATGEPSFEQLARENSSFRQGLTQFIAQKDPALAQKIKENPTLFEMALQESTLQKRSLTFEESKAVGRMEDLGFTRQKALEAYLICDKNEEHAINYLISNPNLGPGDSEFVIMPEASGQLPDHATTQFLSHSSTPADSKVEDITAREDMTPTTTGIPSPNLTRLQSDLLTTEKSGAIERLVALGFTEQQAVDAYLLSDEDEDLAANYLSVVNGESLGGSDDPLDVHQPQTPTDQSSSHNLTHWESKIDGDTHPVANLQTPATQFVTFHQALLYIYLLIAGFLSSRTFLVLLISVIIVIMITQMPCNQPASESQPGDVPTSSPQVPVGGSLTRFMPTTLTQPSKILLETARTLAKEETAGGDSSNATARSGLIPAPQERSGAVHQKA